MKQFRFGMAMKLQNICCEAHRGSFSTRLHILKVESRFGRSKESLHVIRFGLQIRGLVTRHCPEWKYPYFPRRCIFVMKFVFEVAPRKPASSQLQEMKSYWASEAVRKVSSRLTQREADEWIKTLAMSRAIRKDVERAFKESLYRRSEIPATLTLENSIISIASESNMELGIADTGCHRDF